MSLKHPERVKMSRATFRSPENFQRVHRENCSGKFVVDPNYHGTGLCKAICPTCLACGITVRPGMFEGHLPQSFVGSKKLEESHTFRVFACKECGETLDQPVNSSPVLCPVCGTDQYKPSFNFDGDKPTMYKRVKIS